MRRILVVRGGAIGDFVLTLPALKLLRDNFPASHLEILGYKHIVALAENRFYADAVRSIEYAPLAGFFAKGATLDRALADHFASFDLVISYLFDPDRVFEHNVTRCGVADFIACPHKPTSDGHAALQLARPLSEQLGLRLADPAALLFPSAADLAFADEFLSELAQPICAIHPGSGSATKNWPIENWEGLGERLLDGESGVGSVLVVGGEADAASVAPLRSAWNSSCIRFAENLALPNLAAVLSRCALFLGHDSGISHIAAAVDAPCVLLFGPTDPEVWAPANKQVHVVRADTKKLTDIAVEDVYGRAQHRLASGKASPSS